MCIKLALKSKMTKLEARDALGAEVTKRTGQNVGGRVLKDSSTTFEWFVRNRYFSLRKGDWRPQVGHDRSTPSERVVRATLTLLRRLQHPGVDGDRLPKGAPTVRQDPREPHQSS